MVARLILFLVGWTLALSVPVGAVLYLKRDRIRLALEARKQRKLAAQHAHKMLMAARQMCVICLQPCNGMDCYEPRKGWYHEECMKALLG